YYLQQQCLLYLFRGGFVFSSTAFVAFVIIFLVGYCHIRTTNHLERLFREFRTKTDEIGTFPYEMSCLALFFLVFQRYAEGGCSAPSC
ncbi:MAG: transposase, partial [Nostocales cyanobacterium ELA583]